jgi:hypothetical protein
MARVPKSQVRCWLPRLPVIAHDPAGWSAVIDQSNPLSGRSSSSVTLSAPLLGLSFVTVIVNEGDCIPGVDERSRP